MLNNVRHTECNHSSKNSLHKMWNKSAGRMILHDFTFGLSQNISKYLLFVFLFAFFSVRYFLSFDHMLNPLPEGSVMDCIMHIFKGMAVYIPGSDEPLMIPITWLLIQVVLALLVFSYPTKDLYSYGTQVLLRSRQRNIWWISKCIWNISTIIIAYGIGFLTITIVTAIYGELSLIPNVQVNQEMSALWIQSSELTALYIAVLLLPLLTTIAMSLLQMLLSFLLTPIYSFLIVVCILVASAYFCSPLLIGNYTMLCRNTVAYSNGVDTITGVVVDVIIIVASVIGGIVYIKRCDILKKN